MRASGSDRDARVRRWLRWPTIAAPVDFDDYPRPFSPRRATPRKDVGTKAIEATMPRRVEA